MNNSIDRALKLIRDFRDNPRDGLVTLILAAAMTAGGISLTIIGTQAAMGLFAVVMERLQYPMIRSQIDSFRKDFDATPCDQRLMLVQRAAEWNQRIEHEWEANRQWYADWASSDRWNQLPRIAVECRLHEITHMGGLGH